MLQSGQGKEELLLRNSFQVNTVNLKLRKEDYGESVFTLKIELKYISYKSTVKASFLYKVR